MAMQMDEAVSFDALHKHCGVFASPVPPMLKATSSLSVFMCLRPSSMSYFLASSPPRPATRHMFLPFVIFPVCFPSTSAECESQAFRD